MFKLKLIKGKSYTGSLKATLSNPFVEVDDEEQMTELVESGYFVLHSKTETQETPVNSMVIDIPLKNQTLEQLKQYAADKNIDIGTATLKKDILDIILKAISDDITNSFVEVDDEENTPNE